MSRNIKTITKISIISLALVGIGGYAFYEAKNVIMGPVIKIDYPTNGSTLPEQFIEIRGSTKNVNTLLMNERSILMNEKGDFREKLLLSPGYNIIRFEATDKFGKNAKEKLELIFKGKDNYQKNAPESATTTGKIDS